MQASWQQPLSCRQHPNSLQCQVDQAVSASAAETENYLLKNMDNRDAQLKKLMDEKIQTSYQTQEFQRAVIAATKHKTIGANLEGTSAGFVACAFLVLAADKIKRLI